MQQLLNGALPARARRGATTSVTALALLFVAFAATHDEFLPRSHRAVDALIAALVTPLGAQADFSHKTERAVVRIPPGRTVEAKVGMPKGNRIEYAWSVTGGTVFFDKHGEFDEWEKSYAWGRASSGESGILEAGFDGSHGWLWRNNGKEPVEIAVKVTGEFNFLLTSPLGR